MASVPDRPVLVAPDSFKGTFRATEVAAAIGRGLESAGLRPPDLCPVADGGEGTMEVLLTALGGETAAARVHDPLGREVDAGYALIEGGGTATTVGARGAIEAIEDAGGLGGARIVCLCDVRTPFERAAIVFGPQKG